MRGVGKDDQKTIKGRLFKSSGSSFTTNLCGFLNGVDKRILLTRKGSSPLTKTFTSQLQVVWGEFCVCDFLREFNYMGLKLEQRQYLHLLLDPDLLRSFCNQVYCTQRAAFLKGARSRYFR